MSTPLFSLPSFLSSSPPTTRRPSPSHTSSIPYPAPHIAFCLLVVSIAVAVLVHKGVGVVQGVRKAARSEKARMELLAAEEVGGRRREKDGGSGREDRAGENGAVVGQVVGNGPGKGKGKGKGKKESKSRPTQATTSTSSAQPPTNPKITEEQQPLFQSPPVPTPTPSTDDSQTTTPTPSRIPSTHPPAPQLDTHNIALDSDGWQITPTAALPFSSAAGPSSIASSSRSQDNSNSISLSLSQEGSTRGTSVDSSRRASKVEVPEFSPSEEVGRPRAGAAGAGKTNYGLGGLTAAGVEQLSAGGGGGGKKKKRNPSGVRNGGGEGSVAGSELSSDGRPAGGGGGGGGKKRWIPGSGVKPLEMVLGEELEVLRGQLGETEGELKKTKDEVEGLRRDGGRLRGELERVRKTGGGGGEDGELRKENARLLEEVTRLKTAAGLGAVRQGQGEEGRWKAEIERLRTSERAWKSRAEGGERIMLEMSGREKEFQRIHAEHQAAYQQLQARYAQSRHMCMQYESAIQQDRLSRAGPSPISPMMHPGPISSSGVPFNVVNMNGSPFIQGGQFLQPQQNGNGGSHPGSPGMNVNGHGHPQGQLQHPMPHQQLPSPWGPNVPYPHTYPVPATPQNGSPIPAHVDPSPRHSGDFSRNVAWSVLKNRGVPGSPSPQPAPAAPLFYVSDGMERDVSGGITASVSMGEMPSMSMRGLGMEEMNGGEGPEGQGLLATISLPNGMVMSRRPSGEVEGYDGQEGQPGGDNNDGELDMPAAQSGYQDFSNPDLLNGRHDSADDEDPGSPGVPLFASINHPPPQLIAVHLAMEREQRERGRQAAIRRGSLPPSLLPTPSPSASPALVMAGLRGMGVVNVPIGEGGDNQGMGRLGSDSSREGSGSGIFGTDISRSTTATSSAAEADRAASLERDFGKGVEKEETAVGEAGVQAT